MVSGQKSEHVLKMAARVSSTSSEEMASSSEDSAGKDPSKRTWSRFKRG